MRLAWLSVLLSTPLVACAPEPSDITLELAPEIISSLDGTLSVRAVALAEREPSAGELIQLAVAYVDRHGTAHDVAPTEGATDETGAFEATFTGLDWDGTGTVTATIPGTTLTTAATFAVLDRTAPIVTITPPAAAQVQNGNDLKVEVTVNDEIGVSQVFFEASAGRRDRSAVIASGASTVSVSFDFKVENVNVGQTITFYALAADLSGNQGAAMPVTVTVVP